MKVEEKKSIRFRIKFMGFVFVLGLAAVLARAHQLQVLEKEKLDAIARNGIIYETKLPAKRGTIYDHEGQELAVSVETKSVYGHPHQVRKKRETARQLSEILKQPRNRILRLLNSDRPFAWISRKIPPDRTNRIQAADLDGIGTITEIRRYYPAKESGAHLLGFVGTDNQGLEGLEKKFDTYLKGPQTSFLQMRDAMGRPFSVSEPTNNGFRMHDLVLTIDKDIQFKAQAALASAVKKSKAVSGHCIVVAPQTGEVLAMAVVPEFNPNAFTSYTPAQWRNRAVADCYEPGSIIKSFLLAACLDSKLLTPATQINCENGEYKIGNSIIHDTKPHGVLTVSEIIMHSSNIGGIKMGQRMGYALFYDYLKKFGFGTTIGDNFLGERRGFIRPIHQTKPIDQATLFFGQGMSGTSLQIIMAMAAIANGGKLMRPYVVKAIVDPFGHVVKETKPMVVRRVISRETARKVTRILETVVSDEGTAAPAYINGFRVAGKTGTSQKVDPKTRKYSRSKYVASFVGFLPADHPRLVILVTIDEPKGIHYGGLVAGPVFREVGKWSMNYFRINPRIKTHETVDAVCKPSIKTSRQMVSKGLNGIIADNNGRLPDFHGLGIRTVLKKGRSLGIHVAVEGTGLAVNQMPAPGVALEKIQTVTVRFAPPG